MSAITFTPTNVALDPITLNGNIVYGTENYIKRINQKRIETIDGGEVVYDAGPNKGYATLLIKHVSYDEGIAFRTWVATEINFMKETFIISALTNIDLGLGKNTLVPGCRLVKSDTSGMFEFVAPGVFNIEINYTFGVT